MEKQQDIEDDGFLIGLGMFGGCPVCHKTDGHINVNRNHWFLCKEHKLAWCTSANMFGGWRHESEAEWAQNEKMLETQYRTLRKEEVWFPPMPHREEEADAKRGYPQFARGQAMNEQMNLQMDYYPEPMPGPDDLTRAEQITLVREMLFDTLVKCKARGVSSSVLNFGLKSILLDRIITHPHVFVDASWLRLAGNQLVQCHDDEICNDLGPEEVLHGRLAARSWLLEDEQL